MPPSRPTDQPINHQLLTWGALLGQWTQFAQSAVALPPTPDGRRLRDSVPDLILLQAVWFALQDLGRLAPDERALGLDRAEILIDKHAAALASRWSSAGLPPLIAELIDDARLALAQAVERHRRCGASPSSSLPNDYRPDRPAPPPLDAS